MNQQIINFVDLKQNFQWKGFGEARGKSQFNLKNFSFEYQAVQVESEKKIKSQELEYKKLIILGLVSLFICSSLRQFRYHYILKRN